MTTNYYHTLGRFDTEIPSDYFIYSLRWGKWDHKEQHKHIVNSYEFLKHGTSKKHLQLNGKPPSGFARGVVQRFFNERRGPYSSKELDALAMFVADNKNRDTLDNNQIQKCFNLKRALHAPFMQELSNQGYLAVDMEYTQATLTLKATRLHNDYMARIQAEIEAKAENAIVKNEVYMLPKTPYDQGRKWADYEDDI
jgi:hypothetical protein